MLYKKRYPNVAKHLVLAHREEDEKRLNKIVGNKDKVHEILSEPIKLLNLRYFDFCAKNKQCSAALEQTFISVGGYIRRNLGDSNEALLKDFVRLTESANAIPKTDIKNLLTRQDSFRERFFHRKREHSGGNTDMVNKVLDDAKDFLKKYEQEFGNDRELLIEQIEKSQKQLHLSARTVTKIINF